MSVINIGRIKELEDMLTLVTESYVALQEHNEKLERHLKAATMYRKEFQRRLKELAQTEEELKETKRQIEDLHAENRTLRETIRIHEEYREEGKRAAVLAAYGIAEKETS